MTDTYQRILQTIRSCKRVLITTHVRPDGDAIGSTVALCLGLRQLGIASQLLVLSPIPRKYTFLCEENQITAIDIEKGWPANFDLNQFDAILVVDTGTWSQLPGLQDRIEKWPRPKLVIDHHLTQENWADAKLVLTEAAAAGEIIAELFEQAEVKLDKSIATALYVAIASDTGWFQFSNTRPYTMRLAALLMEAGVDTDSLYQHLYQNEKPQRVLLQTRALQSLELLADNKLAVMTLRKSDFTETGAKMGDTENLINIPLQIRDVEVSLFFVESPDEVVASGQLPVASEMQMPTNTQPATSNPQRATPPIRISLRSKGQIDVSKFAEQFGGGGHARAAGIKIAADLPKTRDQIISGALRQIT